MHAMNREFALLDGNIGLEPRRVIDDENGRVGHRHVYGGLVGIDRPAGSRPPWIRDSRRARRRPIVIVGEYDLVLGTWSVRSPSLIVLSDSTDSTVKQVLPWSTAGASLRTRYAVSSTRSGAICINLDFHLRNALREK